MSETELNIRKSHRLYHWSYEKVESEINSKEEMSQVFAHGLGDWGSITGGVIPKTLKMVLDAAFLNTQHNKVRINGKMEQSTEWSFTLPYTSVW